MTLIPTTTRGSPVQARYRIFLKRGDMRTYYIDTVMKHVDDFDPEKECAALAALGPMFPDESWRPTGNYFPGPISYEAILLSVMN